MARAFRATTRGYKADLESHERRLLSQLCADVITMLETRGKQLTGDDAPAGTDAEDDYAHFRRELAGLGDQIDGSDAAGGLAPPDDAALARLLPDASSDPQEAAQFRRLSESSLRESKLADLRAARMALEGEPVSLTEEQAPVFGRALNDVRLTLASRLGVEDEADAEQIHQMAKAGSAATTEALMAELYAFSTWLQETLFSAMLDVMPEDD
ncbi:DUF2017 family protein [Nesterenkonia muleiensis]|uniref:DUF2017 family protein n=1 Tax=Nesterenkonia muleiensis TaxID=2282648 RepID=UPI000E736656|nr:DUF2017 family protein [Nesterenkonia muleiensis]